MAFGGSLIQLESLLHQAPLLLPLPLRVVRRLGGAVTLVPACEGSQRSGGKKTNKKNACISESVPHSHPHHLEAQ